MTEPYMRDGCPFCSKVLVAAAAAQQLGIEEGKGFTAIDAAR
jgi:hypothetical protein